VRAHAFDEASKSGAKAQDRALRARAACHEAGHAVLSAAIDDKPRHVSIRAAHGTLGRSGQKLFNDLAWLGRIRDLCRST
jgi:hypothetical protein